MAKSPIPPEVWSEAEAAYKGQGNGAWRHARAVVEAAGYKASRAQIQKHMERSEVGAAFCSRTTSQWEGGTVIGALPTHVAGSLPWSFQTAEPSSGVTAALYEGPGSTPGSSEPKPKTHLVIPDTQVKPGVPIDHLYWAGLYVAERAPDVVVHLGDHWDMASLSSYEGKGSKYFEGKRYKADVEAGNRALELFEEAMARKNFKPKRKVLLRGNHSQRVLRAVNADPRLEGVIGYHDFNDLALGWEVVDFLVPIEIDGITYSHFFPNRMTGRPIGGNIDTMLRQIGFSFTMGHVQGLSWGRRELANGQVQIGLRAGSFYLHTEEYLTPQGNFHWHGLIAKHEVDGKGGYDPMFVSMGYLKRKFG